jgi:hypothetical protein
MSGTHLGPTTSFSFTLKFFRHLLVCYFVAPSLTRGLIFNLLLLLVLASAVPLRSALSDERSGLSLVSLLLASVYSQYVHKIFTLSVFDTVQLFQSGPGTTDYALFTSSLRYHGSLDTWTFVHMTAAAASYIFYVGLRLVQYSEHFHFHDFGWLLLVAWMILFCNHKCTEFGKPHEPMCASENFQWCGEPYFAVSAISVREILP